MCVAMRKAPAAVETAVPSAAVAKRGNAGWAEARRGYAAREPDGPPDSPAAGS